jgi:hypothetical protein
MVDIKIPRKPVERLNTTESVLIWRTQWPRLPGRGCGAHCQYHCANVACEATKMAIDVLAAYFRSIFAASAGGGTNFPPARRVNASKHLGCYGDGKSKRFAEIIAARAIASKGERVREGI